MKSTVLIVLLILALIFPMIAGPYPQSIMKTVFVYMALALAWDILLRSGQLSFGIAGFYGLGAYASVLAVTHLNLGGVSAVLFGGIFSALVALLLGLIILRLRAMYFAITTLALAEIFRVIIRNWKGFAGGPDGLILPSVVFDGAPVPSYLLVLGVVLIVIGASEFVEKGRFRFALTAIRNNEIVAKSRGVNVFTTLLKAFVLTSGLMGMAGAAFSQLYGFVTPENTFSADFTLLPLAMALLGGIYGTWGPVIGSLVLGIIAEYLKLFMPYGHLIVYGIIIILVILFMPRGFVGLIRDIDTRNRSGKGEDTKTSSSKEVPA